MSEFQHNNLHQYVFFLSLLQVVSISFVQSVAFVCNSIHRRFSIHKTTFESSTQQSYPLVVMSTNTNGVMPDFGDCLEFAIERKRSTSSLRPITSQRNVTCTSCFRHFPSQSTRNWAIICVPYCRRNWRAPNCWRSPKTLQWKWNWKY